METSQYTEWLEIDLDALRNNIRQFRTITARPVMAVVKANAYGHGMAQIARAALEAGAAWLGVARVEEALALRKAGITAPVLVLGYTMPVCVAEAIAANLTLAVGDADAAREYSQAAQAAGGQLRVHGKIDSGMGRLGVQAEQGVNYMRHLFGLPGLDVEGMFTHFARADEPTLDTTAEQIRRFQAVVDALQGQGLRPKIVHAANSAASLYFPQAYYDLVRPGISIYGLNAAPTAPVPESFRTVLSWKTRLASVKDLPAGHGVGYGHRYMTPRAMRVGVLAVGYADGMRRMLNANACLVGGQRLPIIGTVCMDQVMTPLDSFPDARVGDEVVLIGKQGDASLSADDLAAAWGTINYEVTCGMAARVPRIFIN